GTFRWRVPLGCYKDNTFSGGKQIVLKSTLQSYQTNPEESEALTSLALGIEQKTTEIRLVKIRLVGTFTRIRTFPQVKVTKKAVQTHDFLPVLQPQTKGFFVLLSSSSQ
ncbi:hypothetical protein, partial [Prevotella sp. MGM2]|uniref:hypothetical protein n=1 Tax=Prevotella sp. MGM2 TaxID=2033406 RepID=UPI001CBDDF0B